MISVIILSVALYLHIGQWVLVLANAISHDFLVISPFEVFNDAGEWVCYIFFIIGWPVVLSMAVLDFIRHHTD